MLVKVNGKDTASVVAALCKQVRRLLEEVLKWRIWDQGVELATISNLL